MFASSVLKAIHCMTTTFIHGACIKAMQTASRNASQKKKEWAITAIAC